MEVESRLSVGNLEHCISNHPDSVGHVRPRMQREELENLALFAVNSLSNGNTIALQEHYPQKGNKRPRGLVK